MPAPTAQLLLLLPGGQVRITLGPDTTSIGADPACAVSVPDRGLEPFHAVVQQRGGGYEIFDLRSKGGLLVNGRPVEAAVLKPGDQIATGDLRMVFLAPDAAVRRTAAAPGGGSGDAPEVLPLADDDGPPAGRREPARPAPAPAPAAPTQPQTASRRGLARVAGTLLTSVFGAFLGGLFGRLLGALAALPGRPARSQPAAQGSPAVDVGTADLELRVPPEALRVGARVTYGTFGDELVRALKQSPWIVLSVAFHVLLLLLLDVLRIDEPVRRELPPVQAQIAEFTDLAEPEEPSDEDLEVTDPEIEELDDAELDDVVIEDIPPSTDDLDDPGGVDPGRDEDDGLVFDGPLAGGSAGDEGEDLGLSGGLPNGRQAGFRRYMRSLKESGLDIVFVIDSTGSMSDVIADARRRVSEMIGVLGELVPEFRLGMVTYRDHGGEAYVTRTVALTPNRYRVVHFLDGLRAAGGGDTPEAILAGLEAAIEQMPWAEKAKRLVVLIGDAPPHSRDVEDARRLVKKFARRKGVLHSIYTPLGPKGGPLADETARLFEDLARAGRGSFAELAQNQEILMRILELAFGESNRESMQAQVLRVRNGWKSRIYAEMVARSDPWQLVERLERRRLRDSFVRELARSPQRDHLPVFLHVLENPDAPAESRWASAVLARRIVAEHSLDPSLHDLAERLHPDQAESQVRRWTRTFRREAQRAGLPAEMPARKGGAAAPRRLRAPPRHRGR